VPASNDDQKPPSLRIRELTITNFRTFVEPTTISFCDADGNADAIAVFHGDNGSGKSNALAALDLFFLTAPFVLREAKDVGNGMLLSWNNDYAVRGRRMLNISYRDRPHGRSGPTIIEVDFVDSQLGRLRIEYTPSGEQVRIAVLRMPAGKATNDSGNVIPIVGNERDLLRTWLSTPRSIEWTPFSIIDARRSISGSRAPKGNSLMPRQLASDLYSQSTSRSPEDRNAWRTFKSLLHRFLAFKAKEISVEHSNDSVDVIVEEPGKTVLSLDELSSGEQHVIVLCAASLLARSAILAIEEPEISLDAKNQDLLHNILNELAQKDLIDQIILESHVARFDGPNVIRFTRNDDGSTSVRREASLDESKREIERAAKEKGAEHLWVTRDGYTKLPEKMVNELGASNGGHVWFLKGPEHWEAWPEAHVDDLFRGGNGHDD
jgi:AAA domain, putative AbiEii toxin, Type IV TA system